MGFSSSTFFSSTLEYLSERDFNTILRDFNITLIKTGCNLRRHLEKGGGGGEKREGEDINKFGEVTFEIKGNESMEIYDRQLIEIQFYLFEMAPNRMHLNTLAVKGLVQLARRRESKTTRRRWR